MRSRQAGRLRPGVNDGCQQSGGAPAEQAVAGGEVRRRRRCHLVWSGVLTDVQHVCHRRLAAEHRWRIINEGVEQLVVARALAADDGVEGAGLWRQHHPQGGLQLLDAGERGRRVQPAAAGSWHPAEAQLGCLSGWGGEGLHA